MNCIIFSMNRACQLELLLQSMQRHAAWMRPSVLYKHTTFQFGLGYAKLKNMYYIQWEKERHFRSDLIGLAHPYDPFTMFLCDDDVFINPVLFDTTPLDNPNIACISLRLNPHLTYCHPSGGQSRYDTRGWEYSEGDYGYPMSLNGHIYRTADVMPMLKYLGYTNPNELEREMAANPICRRFIHFYDKSSVMNIPLNQVQTMWKLPCGTDSPETLNDKFLQGYRLDSRLYDGYQNTACHELPLMKWISI
jgi:hypothetical protein